VQAISCRFPQKIVTMFFESRGEQRGALNIVNRVGMTDER
jgi:hypothetical protein